MRFLPKKFCVGLLSVPLFLSGSFVFAQIGDIRSGSDRNSDRRSEYCAPSGGSSYSSDSDDDSSDDGGGFNIFQFLFSGGSSDDTEDCYVSDDSDDSYDESYYASDDSEDSYVSYPSDNSGTYASRSYVRPTGAGQPEAASSPNRHRDYYLNSQLMFPRLFLDLRPVTGLNFEGLVMAMPRVRAGFAMVYADLRYTGLFEQGSSPWHTIDGHLRLRPLTTHVLDLAVGGGFMHEQYSGITFGGPSAELTLKGMGGDLVVPIEGRLIFDRKTKVLVRQEVNATADIRFASGPRYSAYASVGYGLQRYYEAVDAKGMLLGLRFIFF